MKAITNLMIYEWDMKDRDWLGYRLQKGDIFTYHHNLLAKRDGGEETIKNGAILCEKTAHPYLHIIEGRDYELFLYLTNLLAKVNEQGFMPTKQQLLAIDAVLRQFEREHQEDRTRKGKLLIKQEFIQDRSYS